jgi:membrane protease YdiL (CAAX protease family)
VAALVELLPPPQVQGEAGALSWLLAVGAYPFLSAWPQEVLYRVFFFHRYGALVGPKVLLATNAAAFGTLHLVYPNLVAPLLSVPAGLLLALTYRRTRAMGPVWLEHALYGLALLGLGLGGYFGAGQA